jgi:hypothetical protein
MATVEEVAAELEKLGVTAQVLPPSRTGTPGGCINVYVGDGQLPDTTAWPADDRDPAWVWGDRYHYRSTSVDAAELAASIAGTLR